MMILGIDPGAKGGFCLMDDDGKIIELMRVGDTETDTADRIKVCVNFSRGDGHELKALIEQVGAMPGQGVTSMFTFGRNYGFLRGVLISLGIPVFEVRPQVWQKTAGASPRTKEEKKTAFKKRLKEKAQQYFPDQKITDDTADAALIARWGIMATKQGLI
jgi:crossover junction endodeoxyribonuclease RuvC